MEEKKKRKPRSVPKKSLKSISEKSEAREHFEVLAQKFIDNPKPFFEDREKEIAEVLEKYGDLEEQSLMEGVIAKKDYALQMTERMMKPLIPFGGTMAKHTPLSLQLTSEFYWEEIVIPLSTKTEFIPNIYDILALLGISRTTFFTYSNEGTAEMRETCEMIRDKFIGYYQRKGMKKEISEIMAMFTLKTTFGQRENDTPQIVVANINTSAQEKIDKYARQFGFEKWSEE